MPRRQLQTQLARAWKRARIWWRFLRPRLRKSADVMLDLAIRAVVLAYQRIIAPAAGKLIATARDSQAYRQSLRVPGWQQVAALVASLGIATATYVWLVEGAYGGLARAYQSANVFVTTLHENPMLPQRPLNGADTEPVNLRVASLFRTIQAMGGHSQDTRLDEVYDGENNPSDKAYWLVYRFADADDSDSDSATSMLSSEANTLEFVYDLLASLGGESSSHGTDGDSSDSLRATTTQSIARLLTGRPGVHARRVRELDSALDADLLKAELRGNVVGAWWHQRLFSSGSIIRGEQAVKLMLEQFQLTTADVDERQAGMASNRLHALETTNEDPTTGFRLHSETLVAFSSELVSMLHADPDVKRARAWLAIVRGYEQYVLLVLVVWMAFLLLLRWIDRMLQRHEIYWGAKRLADTLQTRVSARLSVKKSEDTDENDARDSGPTPDAKGAAQVSDESLLLARAAARLGYSRLRFIAQKRRLRFDAGAGLSASELKLRQEKLEGRSLAFAGIKVCVDEAKQSLASGAPLSADGLESFFVRTRRRARNSRWLITWTAKAMPAVGFLGTVRGIALSLSDADAIVRESTALGQAAALSEVAGTLGLAFTTTLLALLFGLVTSLFNDRQAAEEEALLNELETCLHPLLDPASLKLGSAEETGHAK